MSFWVDDPQVSVPNSLHLAEDQFRPLDHPLMTEWRRFDEPFWATLTRTVAIALVAGGLFAYRWGGLAQWPAASAIMLWPSFGGHWIELWFLNWLRPRLPGRRAQQVAARIAVWFVGGVGLLTGLRLTAASLPWLRVPRVSWWAAGLGFVGIELVAHIALQIRKRPSFFNGRG
jgi:hypothetical protein